MTMWGGGYKTRIHNSLYTQSSCLNETSCESFFVYLRTTLETTTTNGSRDAFSFKIKVTNKVLIV